jgi:hypothetical protein
MKKSMEIDFADLTDILESFTKKLDKMAQPDLIDLAARLKPVAKHCEAIDKFVKDFVKEKLKGKEDVLPGGMFMAKLALVQVSRLDQKALKAAEPDLYEEYSKVDTDQRVTFTLR